MYKSTILKTVFIFAISILLFSCERETTANNLTDLSVDITFDGILRKCPQFSGATSDEGTLTGSCFFYGDNMTIGCGSDNLYNNAASNGFSFAFSVNNVTHTGIYAFREEDTDLDFPNSTVLIQRFTTGLPTSATKIFDNTENLQKSINSFGNCITTNAMVGVQEIDITRYSSENGGIIEGSFYATVYEKPSGCNNYISHIVTASFKVKRVNL